tara:strand:- start:488 stop:835 length:348 start_codon:yes stop_codon:yes gene_type:complete
MEKAELTDEVKRLGGDLESLVERVPSAYLNPRSDEWRIEQFNRNRAPEDQVHTIQEMSDRVSDLFSEPQYVYEKNPDTGQMYRREVGNYDEKQEVDSKLNPLPEQLELFKDASGC